MKNFEKKKESSSFILPKIHLLANGGSFFDAELVAGRQQEGALREKIGLADLGIRVLILPIGRCTPITLLIQS